MRFSISVDPIVLAVIIHFELSIYSKSCFGSLPLSWCFVCAVNL